MQINFDGLIDDFARNKARKASLHGYNCNYATSRPSECALLTVDFKYVEAFLQCVAYYL
jgi:hypothetical protein